MGRCWGGGGGVLRWGLRLGAGGLELEEVLSVHLLADQRTEDRREGGWGCIHPAGQCRFLPGGCKQVDKASVDTSQAQHDACDIVTVTGVVGFWCAGVSPDAPTPRAVWSRPDALRNFSIVRKFDGRPWPTGVCVRTVDVHGCTCALSSTNKSLCGWSCLNKRTPPN